MVDSTSLDGQLHVWLRRGDAVTARELSLLDQEERRRFERLRFDRNQFAAAHVLLRTSLSDYAPVPPRDWRFVRGQHGRPELASPFEATRLRFNLSHTNGLSALVVSRGLDCGIDVENRRGRTPAIDIIQVSRSSFSATEQSLLRDLSPPEQRKRFFELWTLKESYIKATGLGLALPLKRFSFEPAKPVSIAFEPPISDNPNAWQFELASPTADHQLAVCARRGSSEDLSIRLRWRESAAAVAE